MKPLKLKQQLSLFLRENGGWVPKGQIVDGMKWKSEKNFTTFLSSTVDRTLRKLEEASNIACKKGGKSKVYHYIPEHMRERYIPIHKRVGDVYWKTVKESLGYNQTP